MSEPVYSESSLDFFFEDIPDIPGDSASAGLDQLVHSAHQPRRPQDDDDDDDDDDEEKGEDEEDERKPSKWDEVVKDLKKLLDKVEKAQHALDAWSTNRDGKSLVPASDKQKRALSEGKAAVRALLKTLHEENSSHTRYPFLGTADDEMEVDEVDVENVLCSVCGEDGTDDNDILLCDKAGCCRAYHQLCLDPPVSSWGGDDWFCWQCATMDACLEEIMRRQEVGKEQEMTSWEQVYPEDDGLEEEEEEESDDEEDYDPETGLRELRQEKRSERSEKRAGGCSDDDDDDDDDDSDDDDEEK